MVTLATLSGKLKNNFDIDQCPNCPNNSGQIGTCCSSPTVSAVAQTCLLPLPPSFPGRRHWQHPYQPKHPPAPLCVCPRSITLGQWASSSARSSRTPLTGFSAVKKWPPAPTAPTATAMWNASIKRWHKRWLWSPRHTYVQQFGQRSHRISS